MKGTVQGTEGRRFYSRRPVRKKGAHRSTVNASAAMPSVDEKTLALPMFTPSSERSEVISPVSYTHLTLPTTPYV